MLRKHTQTNWPICPHFLCRSQLRAGALENKNKKKGLQLRGKEKQQEKNNNNNKLGRDTLLESINHPYQQQQQQQQEGTQFEYACPSAWVPICIATHKQTQLANLHWTLINRKLLNNNSAEDNPVCSWRKRREEEDTTRAKGKGLWVFGESCERSAVDLTTEPLSLSAQLLLLLVTNLWIRQIGTSKRTSNCNCRS